jgi:hypothetical protein
VAILDTASNWKLKKGTIVCIKFTNTNTAQNPTLNVNNSGAKSIYYNTEVITTGSLWTAGEANRFTSFMYDGTNWVWIGSSVDRNTTYSAMSQNEARAGTATTGRVITAKVLRNTAFPTTDLNNTYSNMKDFWGAAEALMGASNTCMFRCKVSPNFGLGNGWFRFIVSEQNRTGNGEYDIDGSIIQINGDHITYYKVSNGITNRDNLSIVRTNDWLPKRNILTGSGTAGQDKGSGVSPRYFPAKWTFSTGLTAADGDVIFIKIPVAGHDYGVYVSIDNGATYYPVATNGTGRLSTHFPNGSNILLQFDASATVNSVFDLNGGDSRVNVSGGAWRVVNYYDANNSVRQYPSSTTNADYRVLLSNGANDNDETNLTRKDTDFKYNPSTNTLTVGKIANGAKVNFTSDDTTDDNATSWTSVTKVDSATDITFAAFFRRITQMFKNVRYLYNKLNETNTAESILYATPTTAGAYKNYTLSKSIANYKLLIFEPQFYSNVYPSIALPAADFRNHASTGNRLIYNYPVDIQVYYVSDTQVSIYFGNIGNVNISTLHFVIWGIK